MLICTKVQPRKFIQLLPTTVHHNGLFGPLHLPTIDDLGITSHSDMADDVQLSHAGEMNGSSGTVAVDSESQAAERRRVQELLRSVFHCYILARL